MPQDDHVGVTSSTYNEMAERWRLPEDLWRGTQHMRAQAQEWMPQEPAESAAHYAARLKRSILVNYYKDAIDRVVSKPFSRAVTLQNADNLGDRLDALGEDVDRTGKDLTQLGREMFQAGVRFGLTHLLVDFPNVPANATKAEEEAFGARPTFVHVTPDKLLDWKFTRNERSVVVLAEVRFREFRSEPAGRYGSQDREYIRVYTQNTWELWRRKDDDKNFEDPYELIAEGEHSFGGVPLLTYYVNRTGLMKGEPAFLALAWVNLAYYQTQSDYRNGVRHATHAVLFASGVDEETSESWKSVGPSTFFRTSNEKADMKYVEAGGTGLSKAREHLQDLEQAAEQLGAQPLVSRSGDVTATGRAIDEARSLTDAQAWVRSLETALEAAYDMAARWLRQELPEDFHIDVHSDFGLLGAKQEDINAILELRKLKDLPREVVISELRRRSVISENVTSEEIDELLEAEGTNTLAELGPAVPGFGDVDPDEE